jgi:hypothetical protein
MGVVVAGVREMGAGARGGVGWALEAVGWAWVVAGLARVVAGRVCTASTCVGLVQRGGPYDMRWPDGILTCVLTARAHGMA